MVADVLTETQTRYILEKLEIQMPQTRYQIVVRLQ